MDAIVNNSNVKTVVNDCWIPTTRQNTLKYGLAAFRTKSRLQAGFYRDSCVLFQFLGDFKHVFICDYLLQTFLFRLLLNCNGLY